MKVVGGCACVDSDVIAGDFISLFVFVGAFEYPDIVPTSDDCLDLPVLHSEFRGNIRVINAIHHIMCN